MTNPRVRKADLYVTLSAIAVSDAIQDLGSVPSGHLYAALSSTGMSLHDYQTIIGILKDASLVTESNYLLTWIGPKPASTSAEIPPASASSSSTSEVRNA